MIFNKNNPNKQGVTLLDIPHIDELFRSEEIKKLILTIFGLLTTLIFSAQSVVKGTVYDNEDVPLSGVNVYWEGTSIGTITTMDGTFELDYNANYHQLILSYVGFKTDTLHIHQPTELTHWMVEDNALDAVVLSRRKKTAFRSLVQAQNITHITSAELLKAACCNLGESFETNPAIDTHFPDALTGTRQIKMLGLTSPYTLMTFESIPSLRGAAQSFGLGFIPGTWVESIQIGKGAGSVIHGFESIAGHINAELKKPQTDAKVFINAYASTDQRYELNNHLNFKVNDRWYTGLYLHGNLRTHAEDTNDDGFMDMPLGKQLNIMNRWQYINNEKGWMGMLNVQFLTDDKEIGQTAVAHQGHGDGHNHGFSDTWGGRIETTRADASLKMGYVFPNRPYESLGLQTAFSYHDQKSHYGVQVYNINHLSFFSNLLFNSIISDTRHKFIAGWSYGYDLYQEQLLLNQFNRNDISTGLFFEYSYDNLDKLLLTAGIRADYHNRIGFFVSPRLHAQYTLWEGAAIKGSVGRGVRAASIYAENQLYFASSRKWVVEDAGGDIYGLDAEDAWNYGLSFTQGFSLFGRSADIALDFYRTDFVNQVVVDLENPREVRFYNLRGKSFANSFQAEFNSAPLQRTNLRLSYRLADVKTDYSTGKLQKALVPLHRFFANLSYETTLNSKHAQWRFDATYNWLSKQRFPNTTANLPSYQRPEWSSELNTLNAQITRVFNHKLEVYVGGENITNVKQNNPIIAADDPYGMYFDSTLVYGPIFGSMYYAGIRWNL